MLPLAERMRPKTLDEYIGQKHLVGEGAILRQMIESGNIASFILWGPPGVGKTTLARIIAHQLQRPFYTLSAVTSGVKEVRDVIDKAKRNLDREVNNESLIGLSRLQDSLTYFVTSIRGNENLLAKLKFKLQVDELDADLIEDVNIEMSQARETANIYSNILESTMDTYSSIINNNMNTVMRTLTSVSIVMMFPTLIASLFGMNLVNGMENSPFGFAVALVISFVVSGASWALLRYKRLI